MKGRTTTLLIGQDGAPMSRDMLGVPCRGRGSYRGNECAAEEAVPHTAEAAAEQKGKPAGSGGREAERGMPLLTSCSGAPLCSAPRARLTWKPPEEAWPQDGVAWPLSCDDRAEPAGLGTQSVPV